MLASRRAALGTTTLPSLEIQTRDFRADEKKVKEDTGNGNMEALAADTNAMVIDLTETITVA